MRLDGDDLAQAGLLGAAPEYVEGKAGAPFVPGAGLGEGDVSIVASGVAAAGPVPNLSVVVSADMSLPVAA